MKLIVYQDPYMPPDRRWTSLATHGWRRLRTWRATYPEAVELGLEDLDYLTRCNDALD